MVVVGMTSALGPLWLSITISYWKVIVDKRTHVLVDFKRDPSVKKQNKIPVFRRLHK